MTNYTTFGGRVTCTQCNALSKRSRQRCQAPAIKGKTKCRFHGGKSTGPKTKAGRARIAAAHTVHGRETRQKRLQHSLIMSELRCLEEMGFSCGLYPVGTPRLTGRKPLGYPTSAEQWDELWNLSVDDRREAIRNIIRGRLPSGSRL